MTYKARYFLPLGGQHINSPGTGYISATTSQTGGGACFYFCLPRDLCDDDVIHFKAGVNTSHSSDTTVGLMLCTASSSFDAATVQQTIDLDAESDDNADYPPAPARANPNSDLIAAASQEEETDGKGKGFRLWARNASGVSSAIKMRGLTMWLERSPKAE